MDYLVASSLWADPSMHVGEICGSYMFEFSVSKDMKRKNNNNKRRIPTYLLANLLTLIVNKLKISVEQGRVVTTLNNILFILSKDEPV